MAYILYFLYFQANDKNVNDTISGWIFGWHHTCILYFLYFQANDKNFNDTISGWIFGWHHTCILYFLYFQANDKNVNDTISGWIFGSFALVQFLTSPIFGKLVSFNNQFIVAIKTFFTISVFRDNLYNTSYYILNFSEKIPVNHIL